MALDLTVVRGEGTVETFRVEAGAVGSITPGKPVKVGGTGDNYVVLLATGDPEIGTDRMVGIARSTSTDTAAADGVVEVEMIVPNKTVIRGKATTPANIDTDAKLLALLNDTVTFTLTSTTFSINEDEGTDPNVHGLTIIDGNVANGTLDVQVADAAGLSGGSV